MSKKTTTKLGSLTFEIVRQGDKFRVEMREEGLVVERSPAFDSEDEAQAAITNRINAIAPTPEDKYLAGQLARYGIGTPIKPVRK